MSDRPAAKHTLEGLRQRIDYSFEKPAVLTLEEYVQLDAAERIAHDEVRLEWFGSGFRIRTPETISVLRLVKGYLRTTNPYAVGERVVLIDGPPNVGKTTLAMTLAAAAEQDAARRNPDYRGDGKVPVAYIELEPRSTPKSVAASILAFYGTPVGERRTQRDLASNAVDVIIARDTRILIVDELQMLKLQGASGDDAINALKTIVNNAGVVTVLAGIDITQKLGSQAADQLIRRGEVRRMEPFTYANEDGRRRWSALLLAFAREMDLIGWNPEEITAFADQLHALTGGHIGELRRVLSSAMCAALDEKVTPSAPEHLTAEHIFGVSAVNLFPSPRKARRTAAPSAGNVA